MTESTLKEAVLKEAKICVLARNVHINFLKELFTPLILLHQSCYQHPVSLKQCHRFL